MLFSKAMVKVRDVGRIGTPGAYKYSGPIRNYDDWVRQQDALGWPDPNAQYPGPQPQPSGDTVPDENPYSNPLRRPYPQYGYSGHRKDKGTKNAKHHGKYHTPAAATAPAKGASFKMGGGVLMKGVKGAMRPGFGKKGKAQHPGGKAQHPGKGGKKGKGKGSWCS